MVTARAQLVSGNLFLKNSNCCSAEKSVLGELYWFSGENFPSKSFRNVHLPAEISVTEIYRNSGSSFTGIIISAGKKSGGKLDALSGIGAIQTFGAIGNKVRMDKFLFTLNTFFSTHFSRFGPKI